MSETKRTETTVKGNRKPASGNSLVNVLDFFMSNFLASKVHTAEVVKVVGVEAQGVEGPAGYVDCVPMVAQTDAFGQSVPQANLYKLPYFRIQAGSVAIVIDPEPGDIGLAIFTKSDSTGVQQNAETPVQPASYRTFDEGNGFYLGGFLNKQPVDVYIELSQEKTVNIKARSNILIDSSGTVTIKGACVKIEGKSVQLEGPVSTDSGITNTGGTLSSGGKTFDTHTHPGDSGGTTGGPN
jgi:hypothetical protein